MASRRNDWEWDRNGKQWVRWSRSGRCYVNEHDEVVKRPRIEKETASSTTASQSYTATSPPVSIPAAPSTRTRTGTATDSDAYLASSMGQMTVGSPSQSVLSSTPVSHQVSGVAQQQAAAYNLTAQQATKSAARKNPTPQDTYGPALSQAAKGIVQQSPAAQAAYVTAPSQSAKGSTRQPPASQASGSQSYTTVTTDSEGHQTRWEVTAPYRYTEPDSRAERDLNLKRILRGNTGRANPKSAVESKRTTSKDNIRIGRVIEWKLVSPDVSQAVVSWTTDLSHHGNALRYRRFVVIDTKPTSFEAIAIKTYNGQGVALAGVIKGHHAIIYTNSLPQLLPGEEARRTTQGLQESGMLPQAIRVEPIDRTKALDPKSRLDYCDRWEFDYDVVGTRVFGWVAPESMPFLTSHYRTVWARITSAGSGASVASSAATGNVTPGGRSTTQSSSVVSGTPTVTPGTSTNSALVGLATAEAGVITDEQVRQLLRAYRAIAQQQELTLPNTELNDTQIRGLAQYPSYREQFFNNIRATWQREQAAMQQSDDDSEEESEESGTDTS